MIGRVLISEVMTEIGRDRRLLGHLHEVGELMRDRNVGSVVICENRLSERPDHGPRPCALIVVADGVGHRQQVRDYATRPLVSAEREWISRRRPR